MKSTLSNENINIACDSFEKILSNFDIDRKTAIRSRLAFEEVLLKYQKEFGAQQEFEWHEEKIFGRHNIKISVRTRNFDPFAESPEETVMHRLLENVGAAPSWSYKHNCNYVVFHFSKKQKISGLAKIFIAILLAIVLGIIFNLKHETAVFVGETLLAPIFETIMGVMVAFASVMIFLSIVNGICGMGDISTLKNIGKKIITNLLVMLFVYEMIAFVVILPFFDIELGESGTFNLVPIYQMVLDIIPKNIITPFIDGNSLQVIVIAICVGIAIVASVEQLPTLQSVLSQINIVVTFIVTAITKLIPIAVFISVFRIVINNQLTQILSSYKYIVMDVICGIILTVIAVLRMSFIQKVNPITYIKKVLHVGMITISTASSTAAFPTNVDVCEHKLGINKQLVNIGLPLGQVIFMPNTLVEMMLAIFCMCELYGQTITWTSVLMTVIMSYFLSIAIPPLPGAGVACHILMFKQLGIPIEAITIIIAFDFISDRINTSSNLLVLQAELVNVASKLGLLDKQKLRA